MENKVSENDIEELKKIRNESLEIASELGELSYQKILIEIKEKSLKDKIEIIKKREEILLDNLKKIYGNVIINIETGEITPQVL
jgi:hypothetical protein